MTMPQRELYREIFRAEDCGCDVVVTESEHFRVLTLDSIFEQSILAVNDPLRLVHEHTRIMLLVMAFASPERVLMLGLGGGSVLRTLHHHFQTLDFDVVELRARVIEAATTYFQVPVDSRVSFHQRDAREYLKSVRAETVDIVFSDLYHAFDMDDYQGNVLFLRDCFKALSRTGWLVINFHDFPDTGDPFVQVMTALFPDCFVCDSRNANFILFCSKARLNATIKMFRPQVKALEARLQQPLMAMFARCFRIPS